MKRRHTPLRTCIGCSEVRPKRELLRIVRTVEGEVTFDPGGKRSGRGTYLCPSKACFEKATKAKGFERALRHPVSDDEVAHLRQMLKPLLEDSTQGQG